MWRDPGSTGDEETQLYLHRLKGEAWPFLFVPVQGKGDNRQAPEGVLRAAAGQTTGSRRTVKDQITGSSPSQVATG